MNDDGDIDPIEILFRKRDERRARERAERAGEHTTRGAGAQIDAGDVSSYVQRAVELELEELSWTTEGDRNDQLNRSAYNLGQLVVHGLDEHKTRELLRECALAIGLEYGETMRSIESGWSAGVLEPRDLSHVGRASPAKTQAGEGDEQPPASPPPAVEGLDDFWDARAELRLIFGWARARMASPFATLGCVLTRVVASIDGAVVLPPIIGGEASLNLFLALVGRSGDGKGSAERAADTAIRLDGGLDFKVVGVGSGEGIAHQFVKYERGEPDDMKKLADAVLMSVPEVDTLAGLKSRNGSTLLPELRKAWMGERLGFSYVEQSRRLRVEAHHYRLNLIVGVQPARATVLLDDIDGGTPQRYVWLPTTDRTMPDETPRDPQRIVWKRPDLPPLAAFVGLRVMHVCAEAVGTIRAAHLARQRGEGDAIDGHALLCQLKCAAALALLDQRMDVSDEDWQLASMLMQMSAQTRGWVSDQLARSSREANLARAHAEAARDVVRAETLEESQRSKTGRSITRLLRRDGDWMTHKQLRNGVTSSHRPYLDEAIGLLLDAGQIEVDHVAASGQQSKRFRLVEDTS